MSHRLWVTHEKLGPGMLPLAASDAELSYTVHSICIVNLRTTESKIIRMQEAGYKEGHRLTERWAEMVFTNRRVHH